MKRPTFSSVGDVAAYFDALGFAAYDPNSTFVPLLNPNTNGTDNSNIQAAIDTANAAGAGEAALGAGVFTVSTVLVDKSNVWLHGRGNQVTTIKLANGANTQVIVNLNAVDQPNITISDLTIDGNKANQTTGAQGIVLQSCTKPTLMRVRVKNTWNQGIYLNASIDALVDDCDIEGTGATYTTDGSGAGIVVGYGAVGARIINNRLDTINDSAIDIGGNGSSNIVISNNAIKNPQFIGIAFGGGFNTGITATGNTITGSVNAGGIDPGNSIASSVTGNTINACNSGIVVDGGTTIAITGNTINLTTGGHGIYVSGGRGITVTGNTVRQTFGSGIYFDITTDSVIKGNTVEDPNGPTVAIGTYDGITIGGGGTSNNIAIVDNECYDQRGTKRMAWAINVQSYGAGPVTNINIRGLQYRGAVGGPLTRAAGVTGEVDIAAAGAVALAYSGTIATDAFAARIFSIAATNGTAFTISNPTNAFYGQTRTYDIKNSSGGALGAITWGAAFLLAGAFTNPANTKRRTINFWYDGTNWVETNRAAADI